MAVTQCKSSIAEKTIANINMKSKTTNIEIKMANEQKSDAANEAYRNCEIFESKTNSFGRNGNLGTIQCKTYSNGSLFV